MLKKIKSKKLFVVIMLLALFITTGCSYAYLSDNKLKTNKFSMGDNTCKIIEEFEQPQHYQANTTYTKKVRIKNTGTVPCYIRVFVISSNSNVPVTLDIDKNNWTKKGDYYYFNNIVASNEETTDLLKSVTIGNVSSDKLENFEVIVYSESVQAQNYQDSYKAFEDMR